MQVFNSKWVRIVIATSACIVVIALLLYVYLPYQLQRGWRVGVTCRTPTGPGPIKGMVVDFETRHGIANAQITIHNTTPNISDCVPVWEETGWGHSIEDTVIFSDQEGYFEGGFWPYYFEEFTFVISASGCETVEKSVDAETFDYHRATDFPQIYGAVPTFSLECG